MSGASLFVSVFTGIWRVYTQTTGDHGKKGAQREQHDSTSADISDDQSLQPITQPRMID